MGNSYATKVVAKTRPYGQSDGGAVREPPYDYPGSEKTKRELSLSQLTPTSSTTFQSPGESRVTIKILSTRSTATSASGKA